MEMTSRERVLAALNLDQPDRVPWCELAVDGALAQKLMGWKQVPTQAIAAAVRNPYTLEESRAIASRLGMDSISYILRAPTYSQTHTGVDGRMWEPSGCN